MEGMHEVLASTSFFKEFRPDHVALVAGCSKNVRFDSGETIFRQGDPLDSFFILRHGQVALEIFAPGRGTITIDTLGEDDLLGWSWLFAPYRAHIDARASTLVRAIQIDGACLRTKCEQDPVLGYAFMRRLAPIMVQRLEATQLRLLDVYGAHV